MFNFFRNDARVRSVLGAALACATLAAAPVAAQTGRAGRVVLAESRAGAALIQDFGRATTGNASLTCRTAQALVAGFSYLDPSTGKFVLLVGMAFRGPIAITGHTSRSGSGGLVMGAGGGLDAETSSSAIAAGALGSFSVDTGETQMPPDQASAEALFDRTFGAAARQYPGGAPLDHVRRSFWTGSPVAWWGTGQTTVNGVPVTGLLGLVLRNGQVIAVDTIGSAQYRPSLPQS